MLYENLRQLELAHTAALAEVDYTTSQSIQQVIVAIVNDPNSDTHIQGAFRALLGHQAFETLKHLESESLQAFSNPDGSEDLEAIHALNGRKNSEFLCDF